MKTENNKSNYENLWNTNTNIEYNEAQNQNSELATCEVQNSIPTNFVNVKMEETVSNYLPLKDTTSTDKNEHDTRENTNLEDILYYVCNICMFLCIDDTKIKEHLLVVHKNPTKNKILLRLKCPACPNIFYHRQSLRSHLLYDHKVGNIDLELIIETVLFHAAQNNTFVEIGKEAVPLGNNADKTDEQTNVGEEKTTETNEMLETNDSSCEDDNYDDGEEVETDVIEKTEPGIWEKENVDLPQFDISENGNFNNFMKEREGDVKSSSLPVISSCLSSCTYFRCKIKMWDPAKLAYHVSCHSEQGFMCPECKETYTLWRSLSSHLWLVHKIDMQLHTCDQCPYKTYSRSKLNLVHKMVHLKAKACKTNESSCDKREMEKVDCTHPRCKVKMSDPAIRAYHLSCHSEQGFICPECKEPFKLWIYLSSHLWRVHQIDMELYTCDQCPYKTYSRFKMDHVHKMVHLKPSLKATATACKTNESSCEGSGDCDNVAVIESDGIGKGEMEICEKEKEGSPQFSVLRNENVMKKAEVDLKSGGCTHPRCKVKLSDPAKQAYHVSCHSEQGFICPECKETFKLWKYVSSHLWRLHQINMELYTCDQCPYKTYSRAKLNNIHKPVHLRAKLKAKESACETNQSSCEGNGDCDNVTVIESGGIEKREMEICEKEKGDLPQFSVLRNEHVMEKNDVDLNSSGCTHPRCKVKMSDPGKQAYHLSCHFVKGFMCPECKEKHRWWKYLASHLWRVHKIDMDLYSCDKCPYKTYSRAVLNTVHKFIHGKAKPFTCDKCFKRFKNSKQLHNHKVWHTKSQKKTLPCPFCPKRFCQARARDTHVDVVHRKMRRFLCAVCGHASPSKASLDLHYRGHTGEKPFLCSVCAYSTADRNSLRRHQLRHGGDRPYKCRYCAYSCIQSTSFKWHTKSQKKTLPCPFCPKHFCQARARDTHVDVVHRKMRRFLCAVCGHASPSKASLDLHCRGHTGEKPFLCSVCAYSTADRNSLRRHQLRHGGDRPYKCRYCAYSCIQSTSFKWHTKSQKKTLPCPFCPKRFCQARARDTHVDVVHRKMRRFLCAVCGHALPSKASLDLHCRGHTGEKPFLCSVCAYSTADRNSLRRHQLRHGGDRPYKCRYCAYSCIQSTSFKWHTKSQKKTLPCSFCPKRFCQARARDTHVDVVHRKMRRFLCAVCGHASPSKASLDLHCRVHTGEKPFLCSVCAYSTADRNSLRRHQLRHGGDRPYKCRYCAYSCIQSTSFKWHTKSQKKTLPCPFCPKRFCQARARDTHVDVVHRKMRRFLCAVCGHASPSKASLDLHCRGHTGEKPFLCSVCAYSTADRNSLRRHQLRHGGDRPYKCRYCAYSCIQSTSFKLHLKRKHPGLEKDLLFSCSQCQFKTVNEGIYKFHLISTHK